MSGDRMIRFTTAAVVCAAYVASVAAGQPLSQRAMADRFGLSCRKVGQIITGVTVESNGHMPAAEEA